MLRPGREHWPKRLQLRSWLRLAAVFLQAALRGSSERVQQVFACEAEQRLLLPILSVTGVARWIPLAPPCFVTQAGNRFGWVAPLNPEEVAHQCPGLGFLLVPMVRSSEIWLAAVAPHSTATEEGDKRWSLSIRSQCDQSHWGSSAD